MIRGMCSCEAIKLESVVLSAGNVHLRVPYCNKELYRCASKHSKSPTLILRTQSNSHFSRSSSKSQKQKIGLHVSAIRLRLCVSLARITTFLCCIWCVFHLYLLLVISFCTNPLSKSVNSRWIYFYNICVWLYMCV